MSRPAKSPFPWLSLAVLLPLIVLGVLAWLGTRAQVRAAWSLAREDAKVASGYAEASLSRELAAAIETAPLFPDPPVPGVASAADAILDGKDQAALRQLRDDPAAGLSPAGLPRRVVAGLRVFEQSGAAADADVLATLAGTTAPSVLTLLVFAKVGATPEAARWARGEQARAIFRQHPEVAATGNGITRNGAMWWLAADSGKLRFLDPAAIQHALAAAATHLPAWAGLQLSLGDRGLAGSAAGEIMASLPVQFAPDLRLVLTAAHPELLEASARQQARWTLGLLAFAVAIAGGGLWLIHRTLARERRLNELKSQFVASVSHELRAPVASIRLMADALEANKVAPATAKEFHRLIARESARLSTLVGNVLDHARIEQGRRVWRMESCDLVFLTADTLRVMEPLAKEKHITLDSALSPVEAAVDAGAIQQALVNLLDNAVKFSPPGGTVTTALSLNDARSHWALSVSDAGPGIPQHEQALVFERFYRLGEELRRETQGTGIGLSLVKAIAEAHGGSVGLHSAAGQGSTFTLLIPFPS